MKKVFFSIWVFVFFCLISCSTEEVLYSCDPEIDGWTKENIEMIRSLTRNDFLQIDATLQRAVYRAFDKEQKYNLWIQKLEETLLLDWLPEEKTHLESMLNEIINNFDWFEKPDDDIDELEYYVYRWKEYAIENLGWNEQIVGFIIGDPNSITKTSEDNIQLVKSNGPISIQTVVTKNGNEVPADPNNPCICNVQKQSGCWNNPLMDCRKYNCWATNGGCGILWQSGCDGMCFRNDL